MRDVFSISDCGVVCSILVVFLGVVIGSGDFTQELPI